LSTITMAVTGFFHHIGTFLMLVATALIIVTNISAPVVHNIAILKVDLGNSTNAHHSAIHFGTFGNCLVDAQAGGDYCSPSQLGYAPADIMARTEGTQFSQYAADTTRALTKVMVLHPIACAMCFIAFLLSLGAGVVGSFLASVVALLAFLVTVVVLITDFVLFSIIKSNVNDDNSASNAQYSTGMWTLLAAAVCTLLATVVIFFSCCSARLHSRRNRTSKEAGYVSPPRTRRRRFF